ncbi:hypothetical protein C8R44DRAFT_286078 [Mycena epipterygia]|nr:hypothetical protein C8R44DRAFT_286078 [Mycena epipterygia]
MIICLKTKEIMAKDERKRPISTSEPAAVLPASKRPRTNLKPPHKSGDVIVDVVGDGPATAPNPAPPKEDSAPVPPKKSKLPPIKKNKAPTTASGGSVPASGSAGTSNLSIPPKPAPLAREEDSKLPPPIVGARKATIPLSVDLDLSNPMMYAQLFKSGGGSTPSGFTRREKDEERRKELNRMRDEAKSKRVSDAATAFDLQGQMDKITRFEERLRSSRSPAVYPNFLAGALKALQGKKCFAGADLEAREEGEM